MIGLAKLFSRGKRRQAAAQVRLMEAYRRTFEGSGDTTDAELVLVDLAQFTRYYHTTQPGTEDRERAFIEGQRAVFAHIKLWLNLPQEAVDRLSSAVMQEDATDNEEGQIL